MQHGDPTAHLFGAPHSSPEQLLSVAVLDRAVLDLFTIAKDMGASDSSQTTVDQRNNLSFLTDKSSGWAAMRREHCAIAGIDEELMRETVLRWLHDEDNGHLRASVHGRAGARLVEKAEVATKKLFFEMQAGTAAAEARAAQARVCAARQQKAPVKRQVSAKSSEATKAHKEKIVKALKGETCHIRELLFVFDGDLSRERIHQLLKELEAENVVQRDDSFVWHLTAMSDAA